ncbi:MAG: MBL fold metallo-hydrolase [Anaerofustis sp.]
MKITQFTIGPIMTNCYVLSDSGEAVLIDAAEYSEEITNYILNNDLELKMILLTHAHFDHILGARDFAERFRAPVAIGEKDERAMYEPELNGSTYFGVPNFEPLDSCITLTEGDQIQVGDAVLTVIESPGHTIGGISFYMPGYLICGDTLFEDSIGRTDLMTGNYEQIIATIKNKFYTLPDDTVVLPGHGNSTTIGYEKIHNYYVNERS